MELEINKILLGENPRKDFGDIDELSASIKERGVLEPLLVNEKNELIAGERRLRASVKAGLTKVPVIVKDLDSEAIAEVKLIENIQRKDLNLIEEGLAFKKYMKDTKHSNEFLSRKINKPIDYINRRVMLTKLPSTIQKELIKGKLKLGHGLLLCKMEKSQQLKFMKDILEENRSVESAKHSLTSWSKHSCRMREAQFDMKDCKKCKFNGATQSELFETGKVLTGLCLNVSCFKKKTLEKIKELKVQYKKVLWKGSSYELPRGFSSYGIPDKEQERLRNGMNPDNYLVKIDDDGKVDEYFKYKPPKEKGTGTGNSTDKEEILKNRVEKYVDSTLFEKAKELSKLSSLPVKALGVWSMCNKYLNSYGEDEEDKWFKEVFGCNFDYGEKPVEAIFKADSKALDKAIFHLVKYVVKEMDLRDRSITTKTMGFKWEEHWVIDEEFLTLHTKPQLLKLGAELKFGGLHDKMKKKEMIDYILKKDLKGKVPKVILSK